MTSKARFLNACKILMNFDLSTLESAGVIKPGVIGGSDWSRLNKDPLVFLAKLPEDRFDALWALMESQQPTDRSMSEAVRADTRACKIVAQFISTNRSPNETLEDFVRRIVIAVVAEIEQPTALQVAA